MPGIMQLRKNFRIGSDEGNVSGREYGGGSSSQGPAGGASSGGNYGGDSSGGVAPNQMSNTGRDNSITMENIGVPGIEDLTGNFAQFGPVKFGATPNIYTPRSTGDIFDRFNRRQFVVDKPTLGMRIASGIDTLKNFMPSSIVSNMFNLGEVNRNFFDKNVAGNYGFGTGQNEYERYMKARLSGDVGAYGNELDDIPRDENRGINTLQYMLPVAQAQEEIEEEPEEMSFYERLRQNLGLV